MCKIIECSIRQWARVIGHHYEHHNIDYDYQYMRDPYGNEYAFGYRCVVDADRTKFVFCNVAPEQINGYFRRERKG